MLCFVRNADENKWQDDDKHDYYEHKAVYSSLAKAWYRRFEYELTTPPELSAVVLDSSLCTGLGTRRIQLVYDAAFPPWSIVDVHRVCFSSLVVHIESGPGFGLSRDGKDPRELLKSKGRTLKV